jgi:SAM-dependent methyltransferase
VLGLIDPRRRGRIVEIGAGIGSFKARRPETVATDLFPHPWIDVTCDGYELPFRGGSLSHLILVDVFHHLRAPHAFLREARRVLAGNGRLVMLEPYISWTSWPFYGWLHPEPIAWRRAIGAADTAPRARDYYAAQGNATRLFFGGADPGWGGDWTLAHAEVFASFSYLFSGGFSRPALYPARWLGWTRRGDRWLSRFPRLFGARCLVALEPAVLPSARDAA